MEYVFSNRSIKSMLIPLVIEQVLAMTVRITDTVMISYAGEAMISDVALMNMIGCLATTVLAAVDTGDAVIAPQYPGEKAKESTNESASQLVTVNLLFSLTLMILCALFHILILRLLLRRVMPDVMAAASTHFVITALSYSSLRPHNLSTAPHRPTKRTEVTMYISLLMNALSIAGNAIDIFVLHAGVSGVAVPTLISRNVAAVIMVRLVLQSSNEIFICWRHLLTRNRKLIEKVLGIAVPNGIGNGLFVLGKVLITSTVAMFGTIQIAANGVASSVNQIAVLAVNTVNLAIIPLIDRRIDAGEQDQAKAYTKKLMKVSYPHIAIPGGVMVAWLPVILQLFDVSEETYKVTTWLVIPHSILAITLHPTSFNLANSLRVSGDVKVTMYIDIGSMVVFHLGAVVLLGTLYGLGVFGVWAAMGMDQLARSIVFTVRYKNEERGWMKTIQVFAG